MWRRASHLLRATATATNATALSCRVHHPHPPLPPTAIPTLLPAPNVASSLSYATQAAAAAAAAPAARTPRTVGSLLRLNDLRNNRGARKQKIRKGRGIGSGKDKTAGRGHKGQKTRGTARLPGRPYPAPSPPPRSRLQEPLLSDVSAMWTGENCKVHQCWKIDSSELITMKTLKDTGAIGKQIKDGIRLMGHGAEEIKWPIHLEVSRTTARAKAAVDAAGGTVRLVYYN